MSSLMRRGGRSGPRARRTSIRCTGLAIVLHRSEHLACAESQFAAVPRALPTVKCGHTRLDRDVRDPPE
jgi:hypothetical protein